MNVIIKKPLSFGSLEMISSKSLTHRALIAAALSNETCIIKRPLLSEDTLATIDMLKVMGVNFEIGKNEIKVISQKLKRPMTVLNANESGSTLRFLIPVALLNEGYVTFDAKPGLRKRPLSEYISIFKQMNLEFEQENENLPLRVKGPLVPGSYHIRGDISSQFITGLLYALPLLNEDSILTIDTPIESKDYVDMTLFILKQFGIDILFKNNSYYIKGNQKYLQKDYEIPGDFSQAAIFLTAGILGADLTLNRLLLNTHQADEKIIELIENMNGNFLIGNGSLKALKSKTTGCIHDLSQSPDIGPILALLCALSEGKSEIVNASRLRIKESDRITSITTELKKMGAKITETKDGMKIQGVKRLKASMDLDSWNDHRIVMTLAIAAIKTDGVIRIKNAEAINKSYPTFFEDYVKLGGEIEYE
ncbi:MAG: 3-phosphoshikimate 1-carboxyvinyltransferase [Acholeplasma sp.]|nr:3-phosphoshikimate 1-carboxyvinyltransferase [Acholeplasma sp.]